VEKNSNCDDTYIKAITGSIKAIPAIIKNNHEIKKYMNENTVVSNNFFIKNLINMIGESKKVA